MTGDQALSKERRAQAARRFFHALYGDAPDGHLTLWTRHDRRTRWPPDLESAAQLAVSLGQEADVYFGVGLRKVRQHGGRGGAASVKLLPALWADIDIQGEAHAGLDDANPLALPADEAAARAILDALELPPSIVVHSGYGLHAYWLLDEPLVIESLDAVRGLLRRFGKALAAVAADQGCTVDRSVFEPARVLRVPGTFNHKRETPAPVRLLELDVEQRYSLAAVTAALESIEERAAEADTALAADLDADLRTEAAEQRRAYAKAALEMEADELAAVPEGERNDALNRAAFKMGSLKGAYAMEGWPSFSEAEAWDALWAACHGNGLADDHDNGGQRCCRTTFASGWAAGLGRPRTLPRSLLDADKPRTRARERSSDGNGDDDGEEDDPATLDLVAVAGLPHCRPGKHKLEDVGNGKRLIELYGDRLMFCPERRKWRLWDGRRWALGGEEAAMRYAMLTGRGIYAEAMATPGRSAAQRTHKWAKASCNAGRLTSMLRLARTELSVEPDVLDQHPRLLNVRNGTIDLQTGELREHRPEDYLTMLAPVDYDPEATCPTWEAFVAQIMADDERMVRFLQLALGYSLTGETSEQVMFIGFGPGANGKSTLIGVVQELLGDYAAQAPSSTLLATRGDGVPCDVAGLQGKRFVVASESGDGRALDAALVKQMTGGDKIAARFMRQNFFEFRPALKLWLVTNHKPRVSSEDRAIWRRLRPVEFGVTIPREKQDQRLREKLLAEQEGILAWLVRGAVAWYANRLSMPRGVVRALASYRGEMDVLGAFLRECCTEEEDAHAKIGALYRAYKRWCDDVGEHAMTMQRFSRRLTDRGHPPTRRRGTRGRPGLRLLPPEQWRDDGFDALAGIDGISRFAATRAGTHVHMGPRARGAESQNGVKCGNGVNSVNGAEPRKNGHGGGGGPENGQKGKVTERCGEHGERQKQLETLAEPEEPEIGRRRI